MTSERLTRAVKPRFDFLPSGFENTPHPCIVMDDPNGGDPRILALISVIYRPTDMQGLCEMANAYLDSIDPQPKCPICKDTGREPNGDECEYCAAACNAPRVT
jgi:hypothetical protein